MSPDLYTNRHKSVERSLMANLCETKQRIHTTMYLSHIKETIIAIVRIKVQ